MDQRYESLILIIGRVKRRWQWKMALRGLALVSLTVLSLFIASVLLARYFNFSPAALWTLRILAVGLLIWMATAYLVIPLMRLHHQSSSGNSQQQNCMEYQTGNLPPKLSSINSHSFSPPSTLGNRSSSTMSNIVSSLVISKVFDTCGDGLRNLRRTPA